MFAMGDEVGRTQHGNNNAYCQDNESNWFDWSLLKKNADVHRFVKLLIARRLLRDSSAERQRTPLTQMLRNESQKERLLVYLIFNAYWEPLDFELPPLGLDKADSWKRWIDTSLDPPWDIVPWQDAPTVPGHAYWAGPRSVVVLWGSSAKFISQTTPQ